MLTLIPSTSKPFYFSCFNVEYYIWVCIRIILDSKRTTSYALDVNGIRFDMLCDYDKRDPAPNNHHIQVIVPAYTGGLVTIRIPFHGMGWLCPSKSWVFQAFNRNDTLGMDQRRVTRTPPKILFVSLHPFTQRTILGFFSNHFIFYSLTSPRDSSTD